MLIGDRPWFGTTNASSAKVRAMDKGRYERAEGPCMEAILMSQELGISLPTERWPQFSEQQYWPGCARCRHCRSLSPNAPRGRSTCTRLSVNPGVRPPSEPPGDWAGKRWWFWPTRYAWRAQSCPTTASRTPLESRDVIGQAKSMLTARQAITADEALDILRRVSQHSGRRIREIASDVVHGLGQPEGQG